eukprot:scaffold2796_cov31-Tisochrysis_lutea.AAC.1
MKDTWASNDEREHKCRSSATEITPRARQCHRVCSVQPEEGLTNVSSPSLVGSAGRGGLIQQEDVGLANKRPGDGDALLLATRELAATDTHLRVVSVHERFSNELVGIRGHGGLLDLLACGALDLAVADILRHSAHKENGLLTNKSKARTKPAHVELAKVNAIQRDATRVGLIEAL